MAFSWTGPLTVDGAEVALHGTARIDNPFSTGRGGELDGHDPGRQEQPDPRPSDRPSAGRDPPLTQSPELRDGH